MPQSMMEVESEPPPKSQERTKKKHRKWTFGGLFRRKKTKESTSESSDSDDAHSHKKGGFLARRQRRRAANRGSKDVTGSFEHVVMKPSGGSSGNLSEGKRSLKARVEANRDKLRNESSSDEESPRLPRSHRSSKRLSKDMTDCSAMKVLELDSSPRSPRWTAKIVYCESSDYEARYTARTRSATPSPAQSPVTKRAAAAKVNSRPPKPQPPAPRPFIDQKSASFDLLPRPTRHNPRVPPPPPPRDPQRKIIPPLGYTTSFDRPLSYAFESDQPLPKLMMDHNSNITPYKVHSSSSLENRRPYHYYTDQQPRSRRPIHIARTDQHSYLSDSQIGQARSHYGSSDWRIPRGSNSSLYDSSDSREGPETRQLSMVLEAQEQVQNKQPGSINHHQPMTNFHSYEDKQHNSSQNRELNHINHHHLQHKYQDNHQQHQNVKEIKSNSVNSHRKSNNLEDALDELEAIYKSLQMNDEDPPNSRGFESDSGCYRYIDDMAYRRLNRRDSNGSPDCRVIASQAGSYLLVSPALSPPPFANAPPIVPTPDNEPDITLDDVVYRSLKHANNTLKVCDPQPPFGIPLGPVAPAASSDYLHASPKEFYRSSFKPRKTPDIVKDDLAYRNLRKDKNCDSLLSTEDCISSETSMKKKRAARSLSANLLSIIQKENSVSEDKRNSYNEQSSMEKTRSFSDLPDILNCRYKVNRFYTDDSDFTPRASRQFHELPLSTTSTETLTDSKAEVTSANDYCSSQGRPSLALNKPLPKTDSTKNRLPSPSNRTSSPSHNRSSSSTSPHRTSIPSPQRMPSPLPNRTSYSTEGKIKYSSPTSVNLEKYMQRYNENSIHQNHSTPTSIKQYCVEQINYSSEKTYNGSHKEAGNKSNREETAICQKRPSPVSSPHHEYYRKHASKTHATNAASELLSPSIISVNTNKYLRDSQQMRSDALANVEAQTNSEEVPYYSSPLIYVRMPEKNKSATTEEKPVLGGTSLSPATSNVHNIVGNFNRLITDNSPSKSQPKKANENQSFSDNSNKLEDLTQMAVRNTEKDKYNQNDPGSPKRSLPVKENYHSHLLKQFENNSNKNRSVLNNEDRDSSSNEILKNSREQSNSVCSPSSFKINDGIFVSSKQINTPMREIGTNEKMKILFQNEKQPTKTTFYPSLSESKNLSSEHGMKPEISSTEQSNVSSQHSLQLRSSQFIPTSPHKLQTAEGVTSCKAQKPEIESAESFKLHVNNSKKQLDNDIRNSKLLPETFNLNGNNVHKIPSTNNKNENGKFTHTNFNQASNSVNVVNNYFVKSDNEILKMHKFDEEPGVSTDVNEHEILSGNIAIKVLCSNSKHGNSSTQINDENKIEKSMKQTQIKLQGLPHNSETKNMITINPMSAPIKHTSCHSSHSETLNTSQLLLQDNQNFEKYKVENATNKSINDSQKEIKLSKPEVRCQTRNYSSNSSMSDKSTSKELSTAIAAETFLEQTPQQLIKSSIISREEAQEDEILSNDLNKLLSEINSKQERLLNDALLTHERSHELPALIERKDNAAIGKIIQHKPVKLNAFLIDKEFVSNNETESVGSDVCGNDVIRSSESVTDLLQELTRSLDQDFGEEKQAQENSSDEALTDFDIASSVSKDIPQNAAESNSTVSDTSDSRDCSEICEILQDVADKFGAENAFGRPEPNSEQTRTVELLETSHASNYTEPFNSEIDRLDCPSDTDSNAEFVEQICKTASELSDLSSATNSKTTSSNNHSSVAPDRMRTSRPPAQADHNEG